MSDFSRRSLLVAGSALAIVNAVPARAEDKVIRVGYQKYGNLLLLKVSGRLEKKLAEIGWSVAWKPFLSGPPLMEALAAGAIDVGHAGETPPIFAQAAGAPIVYIGSEPPAPHGEGILVWKDSPVQTLSDLKGKSIGFNKGSNVHYLFVAALKKAGLSLHDVNAVYLSPPDGRAAFERGRIDAWVIWDPFFAAAEATGHARLVQDGAGLVANRQFYLANRNFSSEQALKLFLSALDDLDHNNRANPSAAAETLAPQVGLPPDVVGTALRRQSFVLTPINDKIVAQQQTIADTFFTLGLIPRAIHVADAQRTV